jgi:hypothetical protein
LAFLIWGSWTYYINYNTPNDLISALVQGIYSAIMTLLIIHLVTYFYNLLPKSNLYFLLPALFTLVITSAIIVSIHLLIKTSNIFYTIAPALTISFLFSLFTTKKISNNSNNSNKGSKC